MLVRPAYCELAPSGEGLPARDVVRGDEITVCIVLAPPYSRGRDFDRPGEGVDHASLPLDEQPTDVGRLHDAHEVMGP